MSYFLAALLVLAHAWYSAECCTDRGCRPAYEGEVVALAQGYYVRSLDEWVRYGSSQVRWSQDGLYHVCVYTWKVGKVEETDKVRCLYVPVVGS